MRHNYSIFRNFKNIISIFIYKYVILDTLYDILLGVRWLFSAHCPECNSPMKSTMLDMQFDKLVYECKKCKTEWI